MKTIKTLAICALCAIMIASCGKKQETLPGITQADIDSVSYAVGVSFGTMLESSDFQNLNFSMINKGMHDYLDSNKLMITRESAAQYIQNYMMKAQDIKAKIKEEEEKAFFEKNKANEGVVETESGLQYKIENPGNDIKPTAADTVEVKYVGKLLNGTEFDSKTDSTIKFPLNGVIRGWTEGLQLIGEGGKITLWIPFNMGYGPRAAGEKIPAYSTLNFDVELVKVYPAAKVEEKK